MAYTFCVEYIYIYHNKCLQYSCNIIASLILILLSYWLFINNFPFYEIIGGCAVFQIAYSVKTHINISKSLRIQSMWIYYIHMYIIFFISYLPRYLGKSVNYWENFCLVELLAFFIAFLLYKLQKCKYFSILQTLVK